MKKLLLILFISILYGCSKDLEPPHDNLETEQIADTKSVSDFQESKFGSPMVLGEKVQNPYSLKSLRKTSEKARSASGGNVQATNIVATHHYVRFLPKDNHEYTLLLKNVRFFPFPLDRQIVEGGSFYRDPDPANEGKQFSWQYAVVPVQQALPNVQYEILDELFMPENPETEQEVIYNNAGQVLGKVGVKGPLGPEGPTVLRVVVRVWDTKLKQYIPLQGLAVNVINTALGQSLAYGITDATGTAVISGYFKVTKDMYYNIFWCDGMDSKWFLTDGNDNQLFYNVKALAGVTNIDIKSSSTNVVVEQQLGTIHRAAYRTYYKRNSNLLPPANEDAIQIAYKDEEHAYAGGFFHGYWPEQPFVKVNIEIFGRVSGEHLVGTLPIFSTTVHELGHLNHAISSGKAGSQVFNETESIVTESWASAVEKLLTDLEYATYGYSFYSTESLLYRDPNAPPGPPNIRNFVIANSYNFQIWPLGLSTLKYSPVFIDLMDNENQREYFYAKGMQNNWQKPDDHKYNEYPNDNVKNFSIRELQSLLKTTKTIEELRENVKRLSNLQGNSTTAINTLFIKYIEHWRKYNPTPQSSCANIPGVNGCVLVDDFKEISE